MTYGLTLAPSGIDPHVNASSELGIALSSVYDTLVYRALDGGGDTGRLFVPGLAQSWDISDDDLSYTFHLRQDVHFHDGTPFNAEAVRVNIERILDPATRSQKAVYLLGPLSSVEVLGEYDVALHLSSPYSPLLDGLSQVYVGMASPAALTTWGEDYQFHQVGTGPFRFVEYVPNDHLTIARNDDYAWGPELFDHSGTAYLEQVIFRFFADPAGRSLALEAGDVQVMGEVPPLDTNRLETNAQFQVIPVPIPGQSLGFMLNTQRPPLDDPRVRAALLHATDRQSIVQAVFGDRSRVADGPLSASTFGYAPPAPALDMSYDPAMAAALLDEAGWFNVAPGQPRQRDGQPLALDMVVMTWGSVPEVTQLLQAQWLEVGIELRPQTMTYPAALDAASRGDYHVIPQNYSGTDPDLLYPYFYATAAFNWSRVADPELDKLLDEGQSTLSTDQRLAIYAGAQQRIRELNLLVPVRDPTNLNVAASRVQGLRFDAHGWFPLLHDVYLQ